MLNRYASLRQGLVGCWVPSLGASGYRLIDRSGYGNHGTLTNMDPGTDWVPSGGKLALDFDGVNDRVSANASSGVQNPSNGLFSAWIRPTSIGSQQNIVSTWRYNVQSGWQFVIAPSGVIGVLFVNASASDYYGAVSTATVAANKWSHVAAMATDGTASGVRIFINGVESSKTTETSGSANPGSLNSKDMWIGFRQDGLTGTPFLGMIDDVRVYNRALTSSEIQLLYTGGRGVGLMPERIKHRRKTSAAATNRRRRILIGASS
jgi:hypothetical protein